MKLLTLIGLLCLMLIACSPRTYNFHVWQNGNKQFQYQETVGEDGKVIQKKWGVVESYNKQEQKGKDSHSLVEGRSGAYESGTQVVNVFVTAASEHPLSVTTDASFPLSPF